MKLYLLMSVVSLVLTVVAMVQILSTEEKHIRNLPRIAWLLLVLFVPLAGSLVWFFAGRPPAAGRVARSQGAGSQFPEYDRPGRAAAANPEKDAEFLRRVRARAEEQRRRYEEQKRREQQEPPEPGSPPAV